MGEKNDAENSPAGEAGAQEGARRAAEGRGGREGAGKAGRAHGGQPAAREPEAHACMLAFILGDSHNVNRCIVHLCAVDRSMPTLRALSSRHSCGVRLLGLWVAGGE